MKKIICILLGLIVVGTSPAAEQLSFERQLTAAALDSITVEIIAGPGKLKVIGVTGTEIVVDATIRSEDYKELPELIDEFDAKMLFYTKQGDGMIQVMSKPRKSMFNTPNIQIDTTIRLPNHLNLMIDDGSGSIVIDNIAGGVEIDDESGSIRLNSITGSVDIDDRSGSIRLFDIGGDVRIKDKSGSIEARSITGNLSLDDSSGDVNVTDLQGQFQLIDKGSGKIVINGQPWPKQ